MGRENAFLTDIWPGRSNRSGAIPYKGIDHLSQKEESPQAYWGLEFEFYLLR